MLRRFTPSPLPSRRQASEHRWSSKHRFFCWVFVLALCSCSREEAPSPKPTQAAVSSEGKPKPLPPLELTDQTENLLLTWIDDEGDFHVVREIADVPEAARDRVRVVVTDKRQGTTDALYVADLRKKRPDGSYLVQTMSRAQWEELGAKKRRKRMESLAASVTPPSASVPSAGGSNQPATPHGKKQVPGVVAIVYGADWCKPCHQAKDYLKSRGVTVVDKNIEQNELARAEMQQKLERANLAGAAIPIIDVMGQILVGYNPQALDRAVKAASKQAAK